MSIHSYYQSLPRESGLFQKLRVDKALCTLYADLTLCGPGPFHTSKLDESEIDETLEWLTENKAAFQSREEVDKAMAELQQQLHQAMRSHKGLENRFAYIEQVQQEMEDLLLRAFSERPGDWVKPLVGTLLYGETRLAPELFDPAEMQMMLVTGSSVEKGADLLSEAEPAALYGIEPVRWIEDYAKWRNLYLEAASHREVVVILTA